MERGCIHVRACVRGVAVRAVARGAMGTVVCRRSIRHKVRKEQNIEERSIGRKQEVREVAARSSRSVWNRKRSNARAALRRVSAGAAFIKRMLQTHVYVNACLFQQPRTEDTRELTRARNPW